MTCNMHEKLLWSDTRVPAVASLQKLYENGDRGPVMHVCADCRNTLSTWSRQYGFTLVKA